jgi:dolichol-phosphate mannosyltransferase
MPVHNEEDSIRKVITDWLAVLDRLAVDYEIHVYNDGSQDRTGDILNELAANPRVVVHHKTCSGHGSTILLGYREQSDAQWIFQVDSDDEIAAVHFSQFWEQREGHDFLIGKRQNRHLGLIRKMISTVAYLVVLSNYGKCVSDVNCPYRLMRARAFQSCFQSIPENTFAPNVIISGFASLNNLAVKQIEVPFKYRSTGIVSIAGFRLLKSAMRSFAQTFLYRWIRFSG